MWMVAALPARPAYQGSRPHARDPRPQAGHPAQAVGADGARQGGGAPPQILKRAVCGAQAGPRSGRGGRRQGAARVGSGAAAGGSPLAACICRRGEAVAHWGRRGRGGAGGRGLRAGLRPARKRAVAGEGCGLAGRLCGRWPHVHSRMWAQGSAAAGAASNLGSHWPMSCGRAGVAVGCPLTFHGRQVLRGVVQRQRRVAVEAGAAWRNDTQLRDGFDEPAAAAQK